ncbi:LLM class flavin-dependent oxidoreductase [Microvirga zambiensis]|uniref:LLM class flavin-dependent oxidoreductase n=1 Tax=Microvirga zambiensis TaxID=1402137 RepID=UPI00191E1176|nr:LLM class flavin-dependent oxidoreductase [Microvirga zambiensis]
MAALNPNMRRTLGLSVSAGQALRLFADLPAPLQATDLDTIDYLVIRDVIGDQAEEDYYAVLVASSAAARLERIGLVSEVDLYRSDPYLIARALTSLDILSGGRAGLLALGEPQGKQDVGYANTTLDASFVAEFFEVIGKLWNSWEKGALARRWEENLYLERSLLREANHKGAHFAVRGSLPTPRAVQDRPVLLVTDHPLHASVRTQAAAVVSERPPQQGRWIQRLNAASFATGAADTGAIGQLIDVPVTITDWRAFVLFVKGLTPGALTDASSKPQQLGELFGPTRVETHREQEAHHG